MTPASASPQASRVRAARTSSGSSAAATWLYPSLSSSDSLVYPPAPTAPLETAAAASSACSAFRVSPPIRRSTSIGDSAPAVRSIAISRWALAQAVHSGSRRPVDAIDGFAPASKRARAASRRFAATAECNAVNPDVTPRLRTTSVWARVDRSARSVAKAPAKAHAWARVSPYGGVASSRRASNPSPSRRRHRAATSSSCASIFSATEFARSISPAMTASRRKAAF
eukprot:scaffold133291_cov31-Tisochrysis_lutea.AAC.1